ncbi:hypothetical protein [Kamptonema formosum]|uniref:hypothetical protein n=1 Tax=Kamptonema formosum TaxID=331992 RepID=UPI0003485D84|nr:hypothetical protein [Oscillatoria sp. PCC 10802]
MSRTEPQAADSPTTGASLRPIWALAPALLWGAGSSGLVPLRAGAIGPPVGGNWPSPRAAGGDIAVFSEVHARNPVSLRNRVSECLTQMKIAIKYSYCTIKG